MHQGKNLKSLAPGKHDTNKNMALTPPFGLSTDTIQILRVLGALEGAYCNILL